MAFRETIKVPVERIGVIVGHDGRVKSRVEELTNVQLEVTPDGAVIITAVPDAGDPVLAWKARDIVRAMARGFSPSNALTLIDEDSRLLVISLRDSVGTSPDQLKRVAGRIIGERGRTRRVVEQITETKISVYGHTVSIIGTDPGIEYAARAVNMLIEGLPHANVYKYLESMRRSMNRERTEIWETSQE
ncbi:MAG: RNA-processing protein [Candidatus Thorarchaeota archaeon]|nr:MAG: RNA-processing protein [Candidatus Thorarchaeota archaeon]